MLRSLVEHLLLRVLNQLLLQHVATSHDFVKFSRIAIWHHRLLLLVLIHVWIAVMTVYRLAQMLNLFNWVRHQVLVIMLLVRSLWNDSVWASLYFLLSHDFVAHLVDSFQFYVLQWHELLVHTIKLRHSVSRFWYLLLMTIRVIKTGLCFKSLLALLLLLELLSLLIFINGSVFIFQKLLVLILRESWIVLIRILWWKPMICKLQWGIVSDTLQHVNATTGIYSWSSRVTIWRPQDLGCCRNITQGRFGISICVPNDRHLRNKIVHSHIIGLWLLDLEDAGPSICWFR